MEAFKERVTHGYIYKGNIPAYPRPEFHVSHLKHDTNQDGLRGIRKDNGFKSPGKGSLLWWSLVVGPDEITLAEKRLLETTYPDRTEEQAQTQQSFLGKFATSQAFKKSSRQGSYRFTFPLEEVLQAFGDQVCFGAQPVMRVFRTELHKTEVMYTVLVHSPTVEHLFSDLPLLSDDPNSVCSYKDGLFIWRSEAMCEEHRYKLVQKHDEKQMEAEEVSFHKYYVWDHVGVALHVDEHVLEFDADRLRENLKFCHRAKPAINGSSFEQFDQAQEVVKELWPDCPSPLEKAE
ncbi:hypothetical protein GBF38_019517 [Nibea albiflora]|uniref:Uncharacterized protein n=1 Tax=Nibea albiflora TaxID=240163 RepID=A0ACB7F5Q1_NIBAL|nr:hypothetical protein GBF38_019517 [Nibea albiflora]